MTAFWDLMTRLYGFKWTSKEGEFNPEDYGFKLWIEKTGHLTDEQWKRGLKRCEDDLRQSAKTGTECWPPSYAEFIGFCDEQKKLAMYKVFKPVLPEPPEHRSRRRNNGQKAVKRILSLFDDEPSDDG